MPCPCREDSLALLAEYTQGDGLIKHALAVEAAMRAYARRFGEEEHLWAMTGLLHDLDYERYPTREVHPRHGAEVLTERGYPEELVHAVKAHADYTGVARESRLDKALYAVDELSGFVTACALVRPGRQLAGLEARSVRKKLKDKAFARCVSREDIARGAEELGVDLDEHITFVIGAMQEIASELGL